MLSARWPDVCFASFKWKKTLAAGDSLPFCGMLYTTKNLFNHPSSVYICLAAIPFALLIESLLLFQLFAQRAPPSSHPR